jgi:DNA mismatch repair protein MutL
MSEIKVLPELVRNRIAAGEVVERPASVVKELVENSIDANAKRIVIEIADGGHSLIRVADDGMGITSEELPTAIMRHATSKIASIDDIFSITTMGFRGEALPSIASISRVKILSRHHQSDIGHEICVEGGELIDCLPASAPIGTSVSVRDIFYCTPARRKFLKSARSEVSAINEIITRLAISNPGIAFEYINNGKQVFSYVACDDVETRLSTIFSSSAWSDKLIPIKPYKGDGFEVAGFIADPSYTAFNSKMTYCFLNKRWIKMPLVMQVSRQAFEGIIPPRKYPIVFVFLTINPNLVDINVHPAKQEVRFQQERAIRAGILRAISLSVRPNTPNVTNIAVTDENTLPEADLPSIESQAKFRETPNSPVKPLVPDVNSDMDNINLQTTSPYIPIKDSSPFNEPKQRSIQSSLLTKTQEDKTLPTYKMIGQVMDSFLIVESRGQISIIDQHALHERIIYEELLKRSDDITIQKLLVPAIVEFSIIEWATYEEIEQELTAMGFILELFGERTLSLHGVPNVIKTPKAGDFLKECIAELQDGRLAADLREPIRRTIACKAAVKAGERLPDEQVLSLLEKMERGDIPATCPHGRPFVFSLSRDDLYRKFKRI